MTPEERALKIAPEGCDGKHPKGGCLFEQVRDAIYEAVAEERERCSKIADVVSEEQCESYGAEGARDVADAIRGIERESALLVAYRKAQGISY